VKASALLITITAVFLNCCCRMTHSWSTPTVGVPIGR